MLKGKCPICGYVHERRTDTNSKIAHNMMKNIYNLPDITEDIISEVYEIKSYWDSHRTALRNLLVIDPQWAKILEAEAKEYKFVKSNLLNKLVLMEAVSKEGISFKIFYLTWKI